MHVKFDLGIVCTLYMNYSPCVNETELRNSKKNTISSLHKDHLSTETTVTKSLSKTQLAFKANCVLDRFHLYLHHIDGIFKGKIFVDAKSLDYSCQKDIKTCSNTNVCE